MMVSIISCCPRNIFDLRNVSTNVPVRGEVILCNLFSLCNPHTTTCSCFCFFLFHRRFS
eukprot:UN02799